MKIKHLFIDLFCGAGGVTSGIHEAEYAGESIAEVVACINHDANAIRSHSANYPSCVHFTEDIRTISMVPILEVLNEKKLEWEKKGYELYVHLWASLECTNFSRAKGGQPRDADSRTLADHLFRYIEALTPDYIWIENVEEFMCWGPLDDKGKPVSKYQGRDYMKWVDSVMTYNYKFDYRILNAADYGANTSRKRFFGCFANPVLPIQFPSATHSKNPDNGLFSTLKKWKPVKECLDFSDEGNSIFGRKKDLSEKTLQRIYAGLVKYVAGGKENFIKKYYSGRSAGKVNDVDSPCSTITARSGLALVKINFISKYYSGDPDSKNQSIEDPAGAITCIDHHSKVNVAFIQKYNSNNAKTGINNGADINEPSPTVTCQVRMALVQPKFLLKYHGTGENVLSENDTCSTLTTKDRLAFINPEYFIDKQYSGEHNHQSIDQPAGTITTVSKLNLVAAEKWIMNTNFNNVGSSLESPSPVITDNRKHHYIINPAWGGNNGDINNPCCTIVARQDKAPLYCVMVDQEGPVAIGVYDDDSEIMIKIKEFMALYSIVDIKMRMLKVPELLKIQGFKDDYVLIGNQSEQKKFIGNSVPPKVVKALIEANHQALLSFNPKVAVK